MRKLPIAIAIMVAILIFTVGCSMTYSHGFITGDIQRASYKGWVCKTYEGTLVTEGMKTTWNKNNQQSSIDNTFMFSATDDSVIKQLEEAVNNGSKVKLEYNELRFQNPFCKPDTNHIVYKVTLVGHKP